MVTHCADIAIRGAFLQSAQQPAGNQPGIRLHSKKAGLRTDYQTFF